jgi:hypothetical protein
MLGWPVWTLHYPDHESAKKVMPFSLPCRLLQDCLIKLQFPQLSQEDVVINAL